MDWDNESAQDAREPRSGAGAFSGEAGLCPGAARPATASAVQDVRPSAIRQDWKEVLALPAGRRIAAGLVAFSGLLGPSYAPGDPLATAHNEGLRRMGLMIVEAVREAAPERLPEITRLCHSERSEESILPLEEKD